MIARGLGTRAAVRAGGVGVDRSVGRARRLRRRHVRPRGPSRAARAARRLDPVLRVPRSARRAPGGQRALSALSPISRGKRVATLGGTTAYQILLDAQRQHRRRCPCRTTTTCIRTADLVAGRVDAVLLDNIIAERSLRRIGRLRDPARRRWRSATTSAVFAQRRRRAARLGERDPARAHARRLAREDVPRVERVGRQRRRSTSRALSADSSGADGARPRHERQCAVAR